MSTAILSSAFCVCALGQIPLLDGAELSKADQVKTVTATVRVLNTKKDVAGAGVIVAKMGTIAYVLTAAHIVDGADAVDVRIYSDKTYPKAQHTYSAVPVVARRTDNNQDLALLRITGYAGESSGLKICPLQAAPKQKVPAGCAVGCGDTNAPTIHRVPIHEVVLAAKAGAPVRARFWCSKRVPIRGESGGPLVDGHGRLLGICSGASEGQGFYCHLEHVHAFCRQAGLAFLLE
jgi:S1-C subfamily serine protease